MRTIAFCEIEPYCRRVLARHWPGVPIHDDIRTLAPPAADIVCGGFPCQDLSIAGKGAGLEGSRSGLWSELARVIRHVRPRYAIVENVPMLLGRGLGQVLGDLAEIGYDAEWHCIPASAVGAPHVRDRIWIVAYPSDAGLGLEIQPQRERGSEAASDARGDGTFRSVADADGGSLALRGTPRRMGWGEIAANDLASAQGRTHWPAEPDAPRVADGIPNRIHRLRALGNSIVPQIAETIGRAIMRISQ
jgi:DNA (cytosine-5)-methyltransferase 1